MGAKVVHVGMADMEVVRDGCQLKAILGSCVGILIRDPRRKVSGLAHVMMPQCRPGDTARGKYADTAVPDLIARIAALGCATAGLEAILIGGARMFPSGNEAIASIGDQNVAAARRALQDRRVRITYEDTGGSRGRAVVFDNSTGGISVRTLENHQAGERSPVRESGRA
jgi:chemotaxis protein CheD